MADAPKITAEEAKALLRLADLPNLPQDRIDSLVRMYNDFLEGYEKVRAIDTGEREPVTITHRKEP